MAEIIRMKSFRDYFGDGKSYVENQVTDKSRVIVAVTLGTEPLKITAAQQRLNIEEVILDLAKRIKASRKKRNKPKRKAGG